jgi:hypothetical protein
MAWLNIGTAVCIYIFVGAIAKADDLAKAID